MSPSIRSSLLLALLIGLAVPGAAPVEGETAARIASVSSVAPTVEQPGAGNRWEPALGRPLVLAAPFRAPPHSYGAGHRGIDLSGRNGVSIVAPIGGSVSFAGTVVDRGVLSIRVDDRTVLSMEPVETELVAGDVVVRGQSVGEVSAGGHCGEECLHLGVRVDGEYVNPMRFFLGRPMLLPW